MNTLNASSSRHRSTQQRSVSARHVVAFAMATVINAAAILGAAQFETRGERAFAARAVASLTQVAMIQSETATASGTTTAKSVARS